jgi:hypothetical protein
MAITKDQIKFIMANWDKMTSNAIAHDQKISHTTVERIRKQRGLTLTKQQSYNLRDYGNGEATPILTHVRINDLLRSKHYDLGYLHV